jgi:dTDP-3-amino-3,4,6-trideoxy-alpha-D-glucose transaminase
MNVPFFELKPAYDGPRGDFPLAEKLAAEVLSLPIGPHRAADQIDYVCPAMRSFV